MRANMQYYIIDFQDPAGLYPELIRVCVGSATFALSAMVQLCNTMGYRLIHVGESRPSTMHIISLCKYPPTVGDER